MLDSPQHVDLDSLGEAVLNLPCEIQLPDESSSFFAQQGLMVGAEPELRQHARWHNYTVAGLMCLTTFPVLPRTTRWHSIYLLNLSRSGVAFLHSQQLFPLERLKLLLIDDVSKRLLGGMRIRAIEVTHCRRTQARCFTIGAKILDS